LQQLISSLEFDLDKGRQTSLIMPVRVFVSLKRRWNLAGARESRLV
jgi:hypothetical protein